MYVAIRLRGGVNARHDIKETLRLLRLNRVNHCVVVDETPHYKGMLQKVAGYIAWGEVSSESLALLLKHRGELARGVKLTDEYIREKTDYGSIDDFSLAVLRGDADLKDIPGLSPVFRLHPPRKGHRGIKKSYREGGALGYHGNEITRLIKKMR
ncbi:50S ribosomal protein L30 [Candidatus Methanoperedenaceae archaeon GB37]|nr:50S ribosomal protein L30 [Candidatus Methanoperedenaceae archaeon GB37]